MTTQSHTYKPDDALKVPTTEADEIRADFEFWMWRMSGGWPTRNHLGQYKKRNTARLWEEWVRAAAEIARSTHKEAENAKYVREKPRKTAIRNRAAERRVDFMAASLAAYG